MNTQNYVETTLTPEQALREIEELEMEESPSIALPFGEYISQQFDDGEILAFRAARTELVMVESVTNRGKSTFVRNAAFKLATGQSFPPVSDEGEPRKVYLLNFEGSGGRLSDDLKLMSKSLSDEEINLANENLFIAHRPTDDDGATLSLSRHMDRIERDACRHKADVIIVDTASAGFELRDENDNSEVANRVLKPLLNMGRNLNCVVVLIHHIGKMRSEEGNTKESAHRGRGASSWGDFPTSIFNLIGDSNDRDRVRLECAKSKDGEDHSKVMKLNRETRWFEMTDENSQVALTSYQKTLQSIEGLMKSADIVEAGTNLGVSKSQTYENLKKGLERGDLLRPEGKPQGWYVRQPKLYPNSPISIRIRQVGENPEGAVYLANTGDDEAQEIADKFLN